MKKFLIFGVVIFLIVSCCILLIYSLFARGVFSSTATELVLDDEDAANIINSTTILKNESSWSSITGFISNYDQFLKADYEPEHYETEHNDPKTILRFNPYAPETEEALIKYPLPPQMPFNDGPHIAQFKNGQFRKINLTDVEHDHLFESWLNWPLNKPVHGSDDSVSDGPTSNPPKAQSSQTPDDVKTNYPPCPFFTNIKCPGPVNIMTPRSFNIRQVQPYPRIFKIRVTKKKPKTRGPIKLLK